jgi:hypothetical protein
MADPNQSNVCPGANCNQEPITVCTSLPGALTPSNFDQQCRELAEMMCLAVVRTVEEYNRKRRANPGASLPSELMDWKAWAKGLVGGQPGLPDCLDPNDATNANLGESMQVDVSSLSQPSQQTAGKYTNRAYESVFQFGASLSSFDIDDWHDD